MKFGKASKKTIALFAAALILFCSGGVMGTRAIPAIQGDSFNSQLVLSTLNVAVVENGKAVGGAGGAMGKMLAGLEGKKLAPGGEYTEEIGARNSGAYDEYVRVIIRKYWTKDGKTATDLTPDLIKLSYKSQNKTEDYNSSSWYLDTAESTAERSVYYYKKVLGKNSDSDLLFNTLSVDKSVISEENITESKEESGGKTIYTYTYKYDGYTINVEAEAQAVQTHNAAQAIKSVWGVDASKTGISF